MATSLFDTLPELLEAVVFGVGSLVLSAGGVSLEHLALVNLHGGRLPLAVWGAVLGIAAFYLAYLLITDKIRPRVAALR